MFKETFFLHYVSSGGGHQYQYHDPSYSGHWAALFYVMLEVFVIFRILDTQWVKCDLFSGNIIGKLNY